MRKTLTWGPGKLLPIQQDDTNYTNQSPNSTYEADSQVLSSLPMVWMFIPLLPLVNRLYRSLSFHKPAKPACWDKINCVCIYNWKQRDSLKPPSTPQIYGLPPAEYLPSFHGTPTEQVYVREKAKQILKAFYFCQNILTNTHANLQVLKWALSFFMRS